MQLPLNTHRLVEAPTEDCLELRKFEIGVRKIVLSKFIGL